MKGRIRTFNSLVLKAGIRHNITTALLTFLYTAIFASIKLNILPLGLLITAILIALAQFALAPFTSKFISGGISKRIDSWEDKGLSNYKERTALFEDIMTFPRKKALETFCFFAASTFSCTDFGTGSYFSKNIE